MNFGLYLVREGLLPSDDFARLLELQIQSRPQLGTLAIETGRLTVRQVFQVLRRQCDSPTRLFGEVAMELNFLTEDELAVLIYRQSQRALPFCDLLVLHGFAEPDAVAQWLDDYRASQGRVALAAGESSPADVAAAAVC